MRKTFDPFDHRNGKAGAYDSRAAAIAEARQAHLDAIADHGVDSGEAFAALMYHRWVKTGSRRRERS